MKYIFKIKIKGGHSEKEYIEAWEKGSGIIQRSEGAEGTVLYKSIDEPGTLLAIATWKSKAARDAAMGTLRKAEGELRMILDKHEEYGERERLGNFEEVARVEPLK